MAAHRNRAMAGGRLPDVPEGGAAMTMTTDEGRRQGEARRDGGMDRTAAHREWQIQNGTLRFLDAMMKRADRTATTDDATDDLSRQYDDGGRWCGAITRRLAADGLIERAGAIRSARPSRNAGLVTEWRAANDAAIDRRRDGLRNWFRQNPHPPGEDGGAQLDLFPNRTRNKPGECNRRARK